MGKQQRGGTILGLIIGLILGLGVALGVAVYVTKVPVPFINKGEQNNSKLPESERNRNWDPNSPLYGNTSGPKPAPAPAPTVPDYSNAAPVTDPVTQPPATAADPLGELANAQVKAAEAKAKAEAEARAKAAAAAAAASASAPAANDGFNYFVQAGAFRSKTEADAQRAKLAMLGWEARISEREQNGRTVFRVRVGPFAKRGDAEQLKQRLDAAGVDSALVRVQQ
ncbi:MAG: SPOR domain-containing protein [Comamonadaceae bacterium]|nr:SPOR domain-containing protein [Comamonadaceae bacterium]